MANTLLNTAIRSVVVYIIAMFLARLMGKKLISQMTFFDFVIGVSMGSIIANSIVGQTFTSVSAIVSFIILSVLVIATGYMHIKSFKLRKIINSTPDILIDNGNIVETNMKSNRITISELMMKLREKNIFNIANVEFAIMETDGELSVLPKPNEKPLTPNDMNINTTSTGLTHDIIIDGNILEENLKNIGLDKNWLISQLNSQHIKDPSEVFYAGTDNSKKLYVSKKQFNMQNTKTS
ncbi:YetF domain-containing protein [Clostridium neuense]|uniref:YetF domain-containing protein n=1 Tax=Clostridium neuense TaxID=1728934 RepID=A0ABW8TGB1_9CLOT